MSKQLQRQQLRTQRQQLSYKALFQREHQLFRQLIQLPELKQARSIAAYWPSKGEISLIKTLDYFQQQGKQIYLPRMQSQKHMTFHPYCPRSALISNTFGISEPYSRRQKALRQVDVVLLPLVGFDSRGNRLGMGGGYYDRALAFLQQQNWRKKPLLIGIAHDFQQLDTIASESWDIPLSLIVTNRRCLRIGLHRDN